MKTLTSLVILFSLIAGTMGQKTTYFYAADYSIVSDEASATYKKESTSKNARKTLTLTYKLEEKKWVNISKEVAKQVNDTLLSINRNGESVFSTGIERSFFKLDSGVFYFTDRQKGRIVQEGTATNLSPLHKQGTIKSFHLKPYTQKSISHFNNNKLISNENWLKNGSKYFSDIHYYVDSDPEYSMGQSHFRAHMLKGIKESGIDLGQIRDRVVIGWVVMEDGSLTGFHKIAGVYAPLARTLIELIEGTPGEWKPARVDGKAVRYYMQMPFNFIDNTESFESLEFSTGFVVWD